MTMFTAYRNILEFFFKIGGMPGKLQHAVFQAYLTFQKTFPADVNSKRR